jgi:outer membrane receptor protein involved in Fe transport
VRNNRPVQITVWTTPYSQRFDTIADVGLFAQDQWTVRRLTLNAGLRWDYLNMAVPKQHLPATRFAQAADFAPVRCVPC